MRYLCHFLHRHLDFRRSELESLAVLAGVSPLRWEPPPGGHPLSPFWRVELPDDDAARRVAERAMLLKGLLEVWGEGGTWEELEASIRAGLPARDPAYFALTASWRIWVDGFGCAMHDQLAIVQRLAFVPFDGPVRLKDPDHSFRLIRVDTTGTEGVPSLPSYWFFGREVAVPDRTWLAAYRLPARRYLGPTSMDAEMAFIMCNHALVRRGRVAYDPFVGTGSMLIAAAHHGAVTLGADIDMRVIRLGKKDKAGQQVDLWTNFADYRLTPPVGLIRADAHTMPFRAGMQEVFDAILADPPYGVRAGAKKSVFKVVHRVPGRDHYPSTDPYSLGEVLADLLRMAAQRLRLGGRLVYFLPVVPETYDEAMVPSHPAMRVVHNCEQMLTDRYSRRLITMEKVRPFDATADAEHAAGPGAEQMAAIDAMAVYEAVWEQRSADDPRNSGGSDLRRLRGKHI